MRGLTQKQREILGFIKEFIRDKGYSPLTYEIAQHFSLTSPTISVHLRSLEKKGFLTRTGRVRGICLPGEQRILDFRTLYGGRIFKIPIFPLDEIDSERFIERTKNGVYEEICIDKIFFEIKNKDKIFALKCGEDFPIIHILKNDVIILKRLFNTFEEINIDDIVLVGINKVFSLYKVYHIENVGSFETWKQKNFGYSRYFYLKHCRDGTQIKTSYETIMLGKFIGSVRCGNVYPIA